MARAIGHAACLRRPMLASHAHDEPVLPRHHCPQSAYPLPSGGPDSRHRAQRLQQDHHGAPTTPSARSGPSGRAQSATSAPGTRSRATPSGSRKAARARRPPTPCARDGEIDVLNKCRKGSLDGPEDSAEGRARIVDQESNAKLEVSFFGPFWGDYWIIDLGPDYEYAVVGHPSRDYLWILSRTPTLDDATYDGILEPTRSDGLPARAPREDAATSRWFCSISTETLSKRELSPPPQVSSHRVTRSR